MNVEDYFGRSYSSSEVSYNTSRLTDNHRRFESTSSFGAGMDSDSDMLSSECSNSNLLAEDNKKLRRNTLVGSSESVQTLIGISETEEPEEQPNRTSTGTLLAEEAALSQKKTARKRRSSLQHEPKSNPLPRRHFSLTAKIQQTEKEFSSLQDINRSTSVPSVVDPVIDNLKQQDADSDSSLCTETNFSFTEESVTELTSDKQVRCHSPDKLVVDPQRPQSPLKKFIRLLSPTTPHRNISSPVAQHRLLSPNPSAVQSGSRLSEFVSPKHDIVHTLRPRSVSTTVLDPMHTHQRAATLGREQSHKQFSPMTLKPAHIKEGNETTNGQKSKLGSSQMWLGTEDKW